MAWPIMAAVRSLCKKRLCLVDLIANHAERLPVSGSHPNRPWQPYARGKRCRALLPLGASVSAQSPACAAALRRSVRSEEDPTVLVPQYLAQPEHVRQLTVLLPQRCAEAPPQRRMLLRSERGQCVHDRRRRRPPAVAHWPSIHTWALLWPLTHSSRVTVAFLRFLHSAVGCTCSTPRGRRHLQLRDGRVELRLPVGRERARLRAKDVVACCQPNRDRPAHTQGCPCMPPSALRNGCCAAKHCGRCRDGSAS